MYSRMLLILVFLLLSGGVEVASAQCGPDAWTPVVIIQKVHGKDRRVTRKAKKPFEAFAHYKFDRRQVDPAPSGQVARKFDEYGGIKGCDESARLDNFAIQLQNEPGSKGYIVASGPTGDYSKQAHASFTVEYLVNQRGIDNSRLFTVNAGESRDWKVQLWVVPN
jgi:hypothetical protein